MMGFLVFRERMREVYGKYGAYIRPAVKFLLMAAVLTVINQNIGFMTKLQSPLLTVMISAVCGALPYGLISIIAGVFALMHISSVSFEIALLTGAFMIIIMLLYYGFQPKDSYLLLLTPLLFFMKIPYTVPLLVGLSTGLISVIPVSCGVCIYYIFLYIKQNAGVLTGAGSVDIAQKYGQIIKNLVSNQLVFVMILAFAVGILVVFIIRNTSVDYSWTIAVAGGAVAQLAVIFAGDFLFNITIEIFPLIISMLVSVAIAIIYNFCVFTVDYSRTEYLQYEDDDYYYYVKVVPKIAVSTPDVKVQQINARKSGRHGRTV